MALVMNLGDTMRKGTAWIATGHTVRRAIVFLSGIALARLLQPSDFGLLVTASIFTGIAAYFATGGMGQALVRANAVSPADSATVFTVQLGTCTLIYATFYLLSPYIADYFAEPIYKDLIRVSALSFLLRPFVNVPSSLLKRDMRFKELTINSFFATLGSSGISVLMAALGYGVWSLVIPGLLGPIFSAVTLSVRARWAPRLSVNREAARRLSGFGMKFMVNNLLIHLKQQTSNFILGKLFGPSIVGLYNRALSTADAPRHFIGGSAYDALFRGLASMDDQPGKVQYIFLRSTTLLALYTMPCYVLLWWLADPGIVLLYGPKWEPSIEPLRILAISGFLAFGSAGALVAAKNRLGREIWINLETWALMIVAILVGAPFGMAGAAWAVLAVRVYGTLRINRLALRTANVKWMTILRAVLPAYKVAGVMWAYMFVSHEALLKSIKADNPLSYVIAMALVGGAAYALAFLWGGSTELESEARRWKNTARRFTLSA